jgi:23S rRNA (guanosine2251-2'-O)-methyltransferase
VPIYLKNPHSILATLEKRAQDIIEIRLPTKQAGDAWTQVQKEAEAVGIRITQAQVRQDTRRGQRGQRGKQDPGRTSSAEAVVKEHPGVDLSDLFSNVSNGLWLALDTVQDPQNVGAIFRTAAFFNARGIIITTDRSAPLSGTAFDVASGGIEHVPFSLVTNLSRTLDQAQAAGLWILGTSEHAEQDLQTIKPDRPWLLILGNEETGIRRLTSDKCDTLCRIAPKGAVTSLNVSAASAICISHLSQE